MLSLQDKNMGKSKYLLPKEKVNIYVIFPINIFISKVKNLPYLYALKISKKEKRRQSEDEYLECIPI